MTTSNDLEKPNIHVDIEPQRVTPFLRHSRELASESTLRDSIPRLNSYVPGDSHTDPFVSVGHRADDYQAGRRISFAATPISTIAPESPSKSGTTKDEKPFTWNNEASTPEVPTVQVAGQPTGWAAMAEDIRKYDDDKIKDCRDDIDTLMTFAGLFSAAITAFLVESYQTLMPDGPNETLQVLRFIAQQNLEVNAPGVSLDSILPSTSVSPKSGPSNALVFVNVFWFASLITGLVAASFGMLVKQWLREYCTFNNPSPQARLRVRRYREPSLNTWKVFEIAAALPFLLQLALALFFAGLCIFTTSVHTVVGRASTVLVLSWAFCFIAVTALPAFFPRCPYKTAFLKKILKFIHACLPGPLKATNGLDESEIVKGSSMDLLILVDVDGLQADDELLGTTILDSIGQFHRPKLSDLVDFLKEILNHRCQLARKQLAWPVNSDLQSLTDRGKKAIGDIIGKYVGTDGTAVSSTSPEEDSTKIDEICAFLTSSNLQPLSPQCFQLLQWRLASSPKQLFKALIEQWHARFEVQGGWQHEILHTLRHIRDLFGLDFDTIYMHFCTAMEAYHTYLRPNSGQLDNQYSWLEVLSPDDIAITGSFLCDSVRLELSASGAAHSRHSHSAYQATHCAFYLRRFLQTRHTSNVGMDAEMSALLAAAFTTSDQLAARKIFTVCLQQSEDFYREVLSSVLVDSRQRLDKAALKVACKNVHALISSDFLSRTKKEISRYLKLCYIAVGLAFASDEEGTAEDQQSLLTCIALAFVQCQQSNDSAAVSQTSGFESLADLCMGQLHTKNIKHTELTNALEGLRHRPPPVEMTVGHPLRPGTISQEYPLGRSWEFTERLDRNPPNILRYARNQVRDLAADIPIPRRRTFNAPSLMTPVQDIPTEPLPAFHAQPEISPGWPHRDMPTPSYYQVTDIIPEYPLSPP